MHVSQHPDLHHPLDVSPSLANIPLTFDAISDGQWGSPHLAVSTIGFTPCCSHERVVDTNAGNDFCACLGQLIIICNVAWQVRLGASRCEGTYTHTESNLSTCLQHSAANSMSMPVFLRCRKQERPRLCTWNPKDDALLSGKEVPHFDSVLGGAFPHGGIRQLVANLPKNAMDTSTPSKP